MAARGALTAHGDLALLVGVTGFTHEPLGKGPVKALAPATSNEQQTAVDFILLCFSLTAGGEGGGVCWTQQRRGKQEAGSAARRRIFFSWGRRMRPYPPPPCGILCSCMITFCRTWHRIPRFWSEALPSRGRERKVVSKYNRGETVIAESFPCVNKNHASTAAEKVF